MIVPHHVAGGKHHESSCAGSDPGLDLLDILLASLDQIIISAAYESRDETRQLGLVCFFFRAAVITGKRLEVIAGDFSCLLIDHIFIQEQFRQHIKGFTCCDDCEDIVRGMIPQKEFHLSLYPDRFLPFRGTDNDEIVRVLKSVHDHLVKVT